MITKFASEGSTEHDNRKRLPSLPGVRPGLRPAALLSLVCPLVLQGCAAGEWHALFDGKTLSGWQKTDYVGGSDSRVEEGSIVIPAGTALSGVTWGGELPSGDYELQLEARRLEGSDIFCGVTFPAGGSHLSLVLGGWGGTLCGLSSLDGMDASENETMKQLEFEPGKWYRVRIHVTSTSIEAWLGDAAGERQIVDVDIEGRKLDTRFEMRLSKPLGLATWRTKGAIRSLAWRPLAEPQPEP